MILFVMLMMTILPHSQDQLLHGIQVKVLLEPHPALVVVSIDIGRGHGRGCELGEIVRLEHEGQGVPPMCNL